MSFEHRSLVTNQRWKLRAMFAMVVVSGALVWFDKSIADLIGLSRYAPTLMGTFLGFATLILASLSIRCPSCRLSLVWFALSTKPVNSWLDWLLDETTCPKCGYVAKGQASDDAPVE